MLPNKPNCIIVPLACDLTDMGESLGPDTLSRDRKAVEVYGSLHEEGEEPVVVVSAGMANKKKFPYQTEFLGRMMLRDLISELNVPAQYVEFVGPAWGTLGEIKTAECKTRLPKNTLDIRHFHIVTSWYHAPRVWIMCRKILPSFEIHLSAGSWRVAWHEIYKLPGEFVRSILKPQLYTARA